MIKNVIKRDGSIQPFILKRVNDAIRDAYRAVGKTGYKKVVYSVRDILKTMDNEELPVEHIQDIIEQQLMHIGDSAVAREFILFRQRAAFRREWVAAKEEFIATYKRTQNTADATVDDNSNVASKNIGIMNNEIHKSDNIWINRYMILSKLRQIYPDFDAKQYFRDLADHVIYKHDESSFAGAVAPYCCAISMYPFLLNGLKQIGGLSAAPKNLDSFCGMYVNMIFAISAQFAGAVATPEFLLYFDYFARREWGDDYYKHFDKIIRERVSSGETITIQKQIHQYFQQVIYSINQPSAARGLQSAFVNFSYFDRPFFDSMFGEFYFPDGTQPTWDSLCWLQKDFMMWFNEERTRTMLTFPVESFALIYQDGEFADADSARFVAEEYARGHSFFTYISDTADSLSSCCFDGEEVIKVLENGLEKTYTLEEFVNKYSLLENKNNIGTNIYITSYNNAGEKNKNVPITGVLKKEYTGEMYCFNVDGNTITVTPEHIIIVKRISDDQILSLPAKFVFDDIDDYEILMDL